MPDLSVDEVWPEHKELVNMTAGELKEWKENSCSRKASIDPEKVIDRNIFILETNKDEWETTKVPSNLRLDSARSPYVVDQAKRTVAFIKRHRNQEFGDKVSEECPFSKRLIALKNWGHDISK